MEQKISGMIVFVLCFVPSAPAPQKSPAVSTTAYTCSYSWSRDWRRNTVPDGSTGTGWAWPGGGRPCVRPRWRRRSDRPRRWTSPSTRWGPSRSAKRAQLPRWSEKRSTRIRKKNREEFINFDLRWVWGSGHARQSPWKRMWVRKKRRGTRTVNILFEILFQVVNVPENVEEEDMSRDQKMKTRYSDESAGDLHVNALPWPITENLCDQ